MTNLKVYDIIIKKYWQVKYLVGEKISVIIPSYNPNENLINTVRALKNCGFNDIIIVNDGSDEQHLRFFPDKYESCCTVINLKVNHGKGAALKTAFRFFLSHREDRLGVVTVDGDGQHSTDDVVLCCKALLTLNQPCIILGKRNFKQPNIKATSRIANKIINVIFRSVTKQKITDTQTSLRVIPTEYLRDCSRIAGQHNEYEFNVLLNMKEYNMNFKEVRINSVYIRHRQLTHFHPFRDILRICMTILKFMASSLVCTAVDLVSFFLLSKYLGAFLGYASITLCTFIARAISSFLNYNINNNTVFAKEQKPKHSLLRFYTVAIPQAVLSALLVQLLSSLFSAKYAIIKTLLKMLVDTSLFFVSFNFQRKWVFKSKDTQK